MMTTTEKWTPITWHCTNCGSIVTGHQNAKGDIKVECNRCKTVMVRKYKSRRHATIEIYATEIPCVV